MRFKAGVRNISTFSKLTQSLSSVSKTAWIRLSEDSIRFVIHDPEGTQVWANLNIATLFSDYIVTSIASNVINLEVPLPPLTKALRSCALASDACLRLSKRASDDVPCLTLTITTTSGSNFLAAAALVTHEVPVRVLAPAGVASIFEPTAPNADVNIYLPPLVQLRGITDRLNRLVAIGAGTEPDRLILAANLQGEFRMGLERQEVKVETKWDGLVNPVLVGQETVGRGRGEWAEVRVEGKEWARVLKVSTMGKKAVASLTGGSLVLYVILNEEEGEDTVLTYYMRSFVE